MLEKILAQSDPYDPEKRRDSAKDRRLYAEQVKHAQLIANSPEFHVAEAAYRCGYRIRRGVDFKQRFLCDPTNTPLASWSLPNNNEALFAGLISEVGSTWGVGQTMVNPELIF